MAATTPMPPTTTPASDVEDDEATRTTSEDANAGGDDVFADALAEDNTFGSPPEDAFRRDFTINALFYRIADFSVVDYVGGVEDLGKELIRVIGDPNVRFREDPVRMLRACELAGRLGFGIEDEAQRAIRRWRGDIAKASPARLVEELLEILRSGHAGRTFQWMLDLGLAETLLPELEAMIEAESEGLGPFGRILPVLDRVVGGVRDASDSLLLACLLAPVGHARAPRSRGIAPRRAVARRGALGRSSPRSTGWASASACRTRAPSAPPARSSSSSACASRRRWTGRCATSPRIRSGRRRCSCSRCSPTPPVKATR